MEGKNYEQYRFTGTDYAEYFVKVALITGMVCYLFYDSVKAVIIAVPIAMVQYQSMKRLRMKQQKQRLCTQFKSLMESVVTSLTAGYSLEHAFYDAQKDMELIYPRQSEIFEELNRIQTGLSRNVPVEELLLEFGQRSGIEDIENFANVVRAAKRSGGNLIRIIQKTVNSITDKMAVEEEIETMIAAKKLEEKIMMMMPYGILCYLRLCDGEFLQVLYHNLIGGTLMTVFLGCIYLAGRWAERIMEIPI